MIEELLNHSSLGSRPQISHIIKLLSKGSYTKNNLRRICGDEDYSFSRSFDGIVYLLNWLEIIKISDHITLTSSVNHEKTVDDICYLLLRKLSQKKELHYFINIRSLIIDKFIIVNNNLIPLRFSPLRNLLIDLGFFEKDNLVSDHYLIGKQFINWFYDTGITLIEKSRINSYSIEKLKITQENQSKLGFEAEKFVLKYEMMARTKHPTHNKIEIISEKDTSAGYDIVSYINDESIVLDKFIEVKSYSLEPYFYWSVNEVKSAKIEKNNYFLYLVDRDQMNKSSYKPIIIKNPYQRVFNNENEWNIECQKWKFEQKESSK